MTPSMFYLQQEHTGRVFRLQFDDFQIVSSSHDDTILVWDFLDVPPTSMETDSDQSDHNTVAALPLLHPLQEVGGDSNHTSSPGSTN